MFYAYNCVILFSVTRLREYEIEADGSIKRGPEVTRVHFVILEMARKSQSITLSSLFKYLARDDFIFC